MQKKNNSEERKKYLRKNMITKVTIVVTQITILISFIILWEILANKGIDVIDCGTPVLAMHSPFEVVSMYDAYMTYLAYKTFFNS